MYIFVSQLSSGVAGVLSAGSMVFVGAIVVRQHWLLLFRLLSRDGDAPAWQSLPPLILTKLMVVLNTGQ